MVAVGRSARSDTPTSGKETGSGTRRTIAAGRTLRRPTLAGSERRAPWSRVRLLAVALAAAAGVGTIATGDQLTPPDVTMALAAMEPATGQVIADDIQVSREAASTLRTLTPLAIGAVAAALLFFVLRGWSLPQEAPGEPLGPLSMGLFAIAMLLVAPIGAGVALAVAGVRSDPDPLRTLGVTMLGYHAAQAVVAAAWFIRRRAATPLRPLPGPRSVHRSAWHAAGVGVLAVALAWPIVALLVAGVSVAREQVTGESTDRLAHETLRALDAGAGSWRLVVALLAALSAPILEEVLFRGLLQPALRAVGASPWTAITIVSILFAAVHVGAAPPPAIAGLFVLGLAFGWARERSGGLLAPIVAHALFNIGNLVLAGALV